MDIEPSSAVAQDEAASPQVEPAGLAFDQDRYLLHQKHFAIGEMYKVFDSQGAPLLYVKRDAALMRQILQYSAAIGSFLVIAGVFIAITAATDKVAFAIVGLALGAVAATVAAAGLAPKRHIRFCIDEAMQVCVLQVFQDQKIVLFNATYTVADDDLSFVGLCRKNYLDNLLRKRWFVYDANSELIAVVKEDSMFKAVFRRLAGALGGLMRTNFVFFTPDGRAELGVFNRKFTLLDKYVLDMTLDPQREVDRRLCVAMAVLLDTGEKR